MPDIPFHDLLERQKGNPRFLEGEGALKLQREPLKLKGTVVDDIALELHRRMRPKG